MVPSPICGDYGNLSDLDSEVGMHLKVFLASATTRCKGSIDVRYRDMLCTYIRYIHVIASLEHWEKVDESS